MKFISTRAHAALDYMMGVILIVAPFIVNFDNNGPETWVLVSAGAAVWVYGLCTNYEFGAFNLLSVKAHLILDILGGLFLAASPWIFGFADQVYLPHLILGIGEIVFSLFTKTVPVHGAASEDFREHSPTHHGIHNGHYTHAH